MKMPIRLCPTWGSATVLIFWKEKKFFLPKLDLMSPMFFRIAGMQMMMKIKRKSLKMVKIQVLKVTL